MDGFYRADIHAGAAIGAHGGIDDEPLISFRDCAFGAFRFTGSAADALFIDDVCHKSLLEAHI